MLRRGPARKVTVHLNSDTSSSGGFTYEQVFQFLYDKGIAGATLIRPHEGFGSHHRRHAQEGQGAVRSHLPVQIQFVESPEVVEGLLHDLCALVQDGLIEMQETTIVKAVSRETSF